MRIHHIFPVAACAAAAVSVCLAQTSVSFKSVSTASGITPANIYALDVNGDGFADIVKDTAQSPSGFSVSINHGDGTFEPPEAYTLPGKNTIPMCIAAHDFNNDGSIDLAVFLGGTNQVAVYLNYGNGLFKAPIISTINLPSGYTFGQFGCAAADFNADGKVDVATWTANAGWDTPSGLTELYVLQGLGNGTFSSTPHAVFASGPAQGNQGVFVGDYDRDGKADIATETSVEDYSTGNTASSTLHVFYGNNDFTFDHTTPYNSSGIIYLGSGDLNSDGYTDLFAVDSGGASSVQLGTLYGHSGRTFSAYWMNIPNSNEIGSASDGWNWQPELAMGDYNGDGRMDLAMIDWSNGYAQVNTLFFLAGSSPGAYSTQLVPLPTRYTWETTPVSGLFSGGLLKPDLVINQSNNGGNPPQNTPSYLTTLTNQDHNWYGPCIYPRAAYGFNVCGMGLTYQSQQTFDAAVNSFGNLRTVALWVDGTKVQEQKHTWGQHAWFHWKGTFSAGTHHATFVAADIDHREQTYKFTFTVQ